jgi:hypothetical protein
LVNENIPRSQVALAIENSVEYETRQVAALYQALLDRTAAPAELASWVNFLSQGSTLAQVKVQILSSQEYLAGHGKGTSSDFVTALYADVLGRAPDAGASGWESQLANGVSRATVAWMFVFSVESDTDRIESAYQLYLHRPADPGGLAGFVGALEGGIPEATIVAEILGSDEYFARLS